MSVNPLVREAARHLVTVLATGLLAWAGYVLPNAGAKDAQDQCCPIARQCGETINKLVGVE